MDCCTQPRHAPRRFKLLQGCLLPRPLHSFARLEHRCVVFRAETLVKGFLRLLSQALLKLRAVRHASVPLHRPSQTSDRSKALLKLRAVRHKDRSEPTNHAARAA